ncbi:hypothetical protein CO157_05340 [Candidatus Peregrinibacteria bacterium CG_4_9_14_3_um_filter_49_12]|uniref:Peptidase E n=1 Tax=Candidatus Zambryskibacteria bacterium CG22_combo_CG10-13_8_21_14_all_42_17 TaxID=1975118 RepID=A0A2H0BCX5_9BACT|nr:MAG: hypothetical protein COX06_03080 [Candidatus Zambryskibacteria bacterium CG22_combo_CG10-13_8_21_14_all_42_17]PJA67299.1 MAG: hypothetical protein CO157_05340 [Candidatus Peregrinibacteria bacterium CG_4_9_14_3_um_filter_49_12]
MNNLPKIKKHSVTPRKAIAIGGGLLRVGDTLPIDQFIVKESGKKNPAVLFMPTASGDLPAYISAFTRVYRKLGCQVNVLRLASNRKMNEQKIKSLIAVADIIYIGGGNYNFLLSTWKKWGIIPLIKSAYKKGAVLTGLSAGCAALYQHVVDEEDNKPCRLKRGIGILHGVVIPHYKTSSTILPNNFLSSIRKKNTLVTAIEDNCGVFYKNKKLQGAIMSKGGRAFTIWPPYVKKEAVNLYIHKNKSPNS